MLDRPEPCPPAYLWGTLVLAGPDPRSESHGGEVTAGWGLCCPLTPVTFAPQPCFLAYLPIFGYLAIAVDSFLRYYFSLSLLINKRGVSFLQGHVQEKPS